VVRCDRAVFAFNDDRTSATTPETFAQEPAGSLTMPDDAIYLASCGGTQILIHPHQSHAGPMTVEDLWQTAPVWKSICDHYTPDPAVVSQLRSATPARVTVYFATWCGDSKRAVPRFLKAVQEAGNPHLAVELFGIGPDFLSPLETIRERDLTNVPTFVVQRDAKEIGRVVETPTTATVEQDVAAILTGATLPPHPGRYARKALIASGHYELRDAHSKTGKETWELWSTKEGGILTHSLISEGAQKTIETFAALDGHYKPDFIEVTRRDGDHVGRTRASLHDGKWQLHARGDERGLVDQTSVAPAAVILPATITFGWPLFQEHGRDAFVMGADDPIGAIEQMQVGLAGTVVPLLRRRVPSHRVATRTLTYEAQLDSALHVPRLVRLGDGSERRLLDVTGVLPGAIPAADRD
jgi:thiol-disulfide isomerase/thioredoxin